jgi:hypothetical protein
MDAAIGFSRDAHDVAQARSRFRPDDQARSPLGLTGIIRRSSDLAIPPVAHSRYTTGLQMELAVRCRLRPDIGDHTHATGSAGPFTAAEFPAGRSVAVDRRYRMPNKAPAVQPALTHWGGDGNRSSTVWLTPAPPPRALVLVITDPAPAWTRRVSPWTPERFELRPRSSRSGGRAGAVRRMQPFSRRRWTYRQGAGSRGSFRR